MNIKNIPVAIVIIFFFLIGILVGFSIRNYKVMNIPIGKNIFSQGCDYAGKSYKSGESFPSIDGCNSCSCENGRIACTLMACESGLE